MIIPVRNRSIELRENLSALQNSFTEVIVVDDGSTDDTRTVAQLFNTIVIPVEGNHDANYCRNIGAQRAKGDILLFLDSDVVLQKEGWNDLQAVFRDEGVHAVVGIYTEAHRNGNLASQYKNLWIRYSYLQSKRSIDWIFGAVSAIKRDVFFVMGGFDGSMMMRHGAEDLEFGGRIHSANHHIVLLPSLEVEHLKRHSLVSLLKNDFIRSKGIASLAFRRKKVAQSLSSGFVNAYPAFVFSVMLAWVFLFSVAIQAPLSSLFIGIVYLFVNLSFLQYFFQRQGVLRVLLLLPVLFLDHLVSGAGSIVGLLTSSLRSR